MENNKVVITDIKIPFSRWLSITFSFTMAQLLAIGFFYIVGILIILLLAKVIG